METREVMPRPLLTLHAVSRRFGGTQALDRLDLTIEAGTVHALLGENGAGKSTAIRIMAGLEIPDSGRLDLYGTSAQSLTRETAIRHGIGLVPQADSLIGELSLAENMLLSQPGQLLRLRAATARLCEAAAVADIDVPLHTPAARLGRGQRQAGQLLLALVGGAKILLLDEPTAALGPTETGRLYQQLRGMAAAGTAIVFVTHRLAEVRSVADTATVLASGRARWHGRPESVSDAELLAAMVGNLPAEPPRRINPTPGPVALTLDMVTAGCGDLTPIRDVCLQVRSGEVVAVLGVAGNGQRALAETAAGLALPVRGSRTASRPVAYVPEQRMDGLLPGWAAAWSAMVTRLREPQFARAGILDRDAVTAAAAAQLQRHDVRPTDPDLTVTALSGGNQQKLLVGRELDLHPAVAVLHSPTQGLDAKAARTIQADVAAAAAAGTAVLLVSTDLDEVRALADRLVVLSSGRIIGEFAAADVDEAVYRRLTSSVRRPGQEESPT
ncbi:ATP-binding cassette domain-containing protein [Amycolatopsis tolypomycina]|uniref:ATP-binding cassette domain-containing protein n=1 Tax=Amycolatopsis tolypomycina TaxID=208445 RepID=UPI0033B89BE3